MTAPATAREQLAQALGRSLTAEEWARVLRHNPHLQDTVGTPRSVAIAANALADAARVPAGDDAGRHPRAGTGDSRGATTPTRADSPAPGRNGTATATNPAGRGTVAPGTRSGRSGAVAANGVVAVCLPWDALASDNLRVAPLGRVGKEARARYREAKARAVRRIRDQVGALERTLRGLPWAAPSAIVVEVWLPDDVRRDVLNLAKLVHDALTEAEVIADDVHLADIRWRRAGIDREHPRAELRLVPLEGPAA